MHKLHECIIKRSHQFVYVHVLENNIAYVDKIWCIQSALNFVKLNFGFHQFNKTISSFFAFLSFRHKLRFKCPTGILLSKKAFTLFANRLSNVIAIDFPFLTPYYICFFPVHCNINCVLNVPIPQMILYGI